MSFSVFEKIDPSCQNGSMEKAKNIPYHQRPYASIAERTLVDISIYSPRPQIAGTGHSHSKISIHSPRAGRDCRYPNAPLITQISIHSPHTGRDPPLRFPRRSRSYFNPLSPHGERRGSRRPTKPTYDFNPLSPHGERRKPTKARACGTKFQSTLPAWGETERLFYLALRFTFQSTLPAWGETLDKDRRSLLGEYFNPLSPHGERQMLNNKCYAYIKFQSTLPAWGETASGAEYRAQRQISIHSPRMGRDLTVRAYLAAPSISIHSPRMGRDQAAGRQPRPGVYFNPLSPYGERRPALVYDLHQESFQSTLPAWGETRRRAVCAVHRSISIHSPRMGRDQPSHDGSGMAAHFNPLSPHGERPVLVPVLPPHSRFQSTLPAWGETDHPLHPRIRRAISIHSPRMGRDRTAPPWPAGCWTFQSTLPAWGETVVRDIWHRDTPFISIHSPRMGRDQMPTQAPRKGNEFQSTLPAWGETYINCKIM